MVRVYGLGVALSRQRHAFGMIPQDVVRYCFGLSGVLMMEQREAGAEAYDVHAEIPDLPMSDPELRARCSKASDRVAAEIVARTRAGQQCCLCIAGSAICYSSTYRHIIAALRAEGIRVSVETGVSSVEEVCAALEYDYGMYGLFIIDASRFIDKGIIPSGHTALVLMAMAQWLAHANQPKEALKVLRDRIRAGYVGAKEAYAVSIHPAGMQLVQLDMSDPQSHWEERTFNEETTLFVPPLGTDTLLVR